MLAQLVSMTLLLGAAPAQPDSLADEREHFASLESASRELPPDYRLLWEAARAGTTLGVALGGTDEARAVLRRSVELAASAVALDPAGVEGHYWAAAASGLMADAEDGRTKIRVAERAWLESERVLELDSLHAGAHHIQGRLNAAVMRLSWVKRTLAKHLLGAELLGRASWSEAVRHLRLAAELAPEEPLHHLELGLAYRDLRRTEEANRALEAALAAPTNRAVDDAYKLRARRLLDSGS